MTFSVIVPTYQEEQYIGPCLESVRNQILEDDSVEIIVSDAGSQDATRSIAQRYTDTIVLSAKRGIAFGRNMGAAAAKNEILVFLDADAVLDSHFLSECKKTFTDMNIAGITGVAHPYDGSFLPRFVYIATYGLVRFFSFFGLKMYPGICAVYRTEAFRAVGGFREDLGIVEDLDLSRRISRQGRCVVQKKAKAGVSTRRLEKNILSTVLFHIWNELRYLATGKAARSYPKIEETKTWKDLWKQ
jgi:cellulose synthase/poly-beta-1,6-N-acetylglucosamine synthase-like glycosyltransferase